MRLRHLLADSPGHVLSCGWRGGERCAKGCFVGGPPRNDSGSTPGGHGVWDGLVAACADRRGGVPASAVGLGIRAPFKIVLPMKF